MSLPPGSTLPVDDDGAWAPWRGQWRLAEGVAYLNHGSFGPPPEPVRVARRRWIDELDRQPMDFFVRRLDALWHAARDRLAAFVGASPSRLILVDNATYAMNVVAASFPLAAGDEVLLTDHEYGAVRRIWERACRRAGAAVTTAALPWPVASHEQIVEGTIRAITPRTRLLVVSQITSPTALVMPAGEICRQAQRRGVAVCVDGPHAVAQIPLALDDLDCDYYTASCHKWLSAPLGSGFLYVHPRRQAEVAPPILSWGRPSVGREPAWDDEFRWSGTRDLSALLAVPAAIDFLERVGLDAFRQRTHFLARYARERLGEATGLAPCVPDDERFYGSMALSSLAPCDAVRLQDRLWSEHRIEAPCVDFHGRQYLRVSCHLYTTREQIDRLVGALRGAWRASPP